MAEIVKMPKLGFDMAEGMLVRWVVGEGEAVETGQVLAEIETDKATVEVEATATGIVRKHVVQEGTSVPVGAAIAVIGDEGEELDDLDLGAEAPAPPSGKAEEAAPEPETSPAKSEPVASGAADYPGGVKASPVARRLAQEMGIDLTRVEGSGPSGRVVKADVEAQGGRSDRQMPTPAYQPASTHAPRSTERVPVSKLRAIIGKRMTKSKLELPHFYVTSDIDAGPVMAARAQLNNALPEDEKLSVNDFIVRAAALALREFPNLNASLEGETIVRHGEINIGIAVAVEQGLLTVVARDADQKPIRTLSSEIRAMVERTRSGKVRPEDVEGSTFTVSNLGMFDVDHFIAIINPPEAAILAIGSVREEPVYEGANLVRGQRMKVTLSADHRVTDGAEAARWLQVFKRYFEQPFLMFI
jgi:pyruvate dehydrogenase E2 component (dihydrolipoamide acetyltransferase)